MLAGGGREAFAVWLESVFVCMFVCVCVGGVREQT